jgi:hypothetical protein
MLYLVLNVEDPYQKWVLDICTTREKAEHLKEQYCNNFRENQHYYECDIIDIEEVPITNEEIIWSYDVERYN